MELSQYGGSSVLSLCLPNSPSPRIVFFQLVISHPLDSTHLSTSLFVVSALMSVLIRTHHWQRRESFNNIDIEVDRSPQKFTMLSTGPEKDCGRGIRVVIGSLLSVVVSIVKEVVVALS
jgi:hypothetical protein